MKYKYLSLILLTFCITTANAQRSLLSNTRSDLLALNTEKHYDYKRIAVGYTSQPRPMPSNAGDGIVHVSYMQGVDVAIVTPMYKNDSLSFTGNGLKVGLQIGAMIPLAHTEYNQFAMSATLYYQTFSVKDAYYDNASKKKPRLNVSSMSIPLMLTMVGRNRKGGMVGYYCELGAYLNYVFQAKDGGANYIKQFSAVMIQPQAGFGICLTRDGGRTRFNNRTNWMGFYVSDAVTNMVKGNGETLHALFYGIKYGHCIN
ncbi:MAG: hypothetical protein K0Q79_1449 [Flavipsychrobacter sp.]|jgi:hypothetical protein|nr:hypothetical protein [Flavipsychrobacter sp.]